MSAEDRLLTEVICTSPEGSTHTGKFRSSTDPLTKSIAQFKTVGGNYGRLQDLGTDLRTCSFTIFFEGEDHDLLSEAFIASLEESGAWTIEHPVRGRLLNQYPTSFTPANDPVSSGNITAIETAWITDYPSDNPQSQVQRASQIVDAVNTVNESSAKSFFDNAKTDTFNLIDKIVIGVSNGKDAINNALGTAISAINGGIDIMDSISRGITQTLDNIVGQTLELASQTQVFCQTPASLLSDVTGRAGAYGTAILSIISDTLSGTPAEKRNQATTTELTSLATLCGLCLSIINDPGIETREQAIEVSATIYDLFYQVTNALDGYADDFDGMLYYQKYFSQTDTFANVAALVGRVQAYLLELAISLKKEKTVTLEKPMSAIFACLTYYDNCDDDMYDLFVKTNKLKLSEIMAIPAGRELVIYVD